MLQAILGDKYGTCPLPVAVPVKQFETLMTEATSLKLDTKLMNEWYILDNNAMPPVYVLQVKRIDVNEMNLSSLNEQKMKSSNKHCFIDFITLE